MSRISYDRSRGAPSISRRDLLRLATLGVLGTGSGLLPAIAAQLPAASEQRRHLVLLWMPGGPSQLDTFDMKPGHANGGSFKEIATRVPGMRWCEHLPQLAELADHLAIVRSLSTKEGDHDRGTYLVRTGRRLGGPVRYPSFGSALAKELGDAESELPQYVSVAPTMALSPAAFGSGFLGPQHAAATVSALAPAAAGGAATTAEGGAPAAGFARLGLDYLQPPGGLSSERETARKELWQHLQRDFLRTRAAANATTQDTVFRRAMRLMSSSAADAFHLTQENDATRERYGRGLFGQGCLLARRLIERGVPLVEVSLAGDGGLAWDTHLNNFPTVTQLCRELDTGWSALLTDLKQRGLLDSTTFLWIGEFGRTPVINNMAGRDHFPDAWSCVLGGAGIQGGAIYGSTSADGMEVTDGKLEIGDVLATVCAALGIDPQRENLTEIGRPIPIMEGQPVRQLLA